MPSVVWVDQLAKRQLFANTSQVLFIPTHAALVWLLDLAFHYLLHMIYNWQFKIGGHLCLVSLAIA